MMPSDPDDAVRSRRDSHVRLCSSAEWSVVPPLGGRIEWLEALELLDDLADDQAALDGRLRELRGHAFFAPLRAVRETLARVLRAAEPSTVHRVFLPRSPLAEYLGGVYAWLFAAIDAFRGPAGEVAQRLDVAAALHFDELGERIREDLDALSMESSDEGAVRALRAACETLLTACLALEQRLDEAEG